VFSVPSLTKITSVWIVPCGVEISRGNSEAARDVLGLPTAPQDLRHTSTLSQKITFVNPQSARCPCGRHTRTGAGAAESVFEHRSIVIQVFATRRGRAAARRQWLVALFAAAARPILRELPKPLRPGLQNKIHKPAPLRLPRRPPFVSAGQSAITHVLWLN
jgi:hypothetical protein